MKKIRTTLATSACSMARHVIAAQTVSILMSLRGECRLLAPPIRSVYVARVGFEIDYKLTRINHIVGNKGD